MSLQSIAQTLHNEAANGSRIIIDDTLLGSGTAFSTLVKDDLLRSAGNVVLTANAADIPANPPGSSFSFPAGTPAAQAESFLNLSAVKVTVTISEINSTIQVQLDVSVTELAAGGTTPWVFSTSFPSLLGWTFDSLSLQLPQLYFIYGKNNLPPGLSEGLNFSSDFTLGNILAPVQQFLQLFDINKVKLSPLTGQITRTTFGPAFILNGNMTGIQPINMQALSIATPSIQVSMGYAKRPGSTSNEYQPAGQIIMCAQTTLSGQQDPLDVFFMLPYNTSSTSLTMVIAPKPGSVTTSINNLGEWMAGKSWDDFFANPPANQLLPFLSNFGLQSYSLSFTLGTFSILSTGLSVGTLRPWVIVQDKLVMSKFSVSWQLIDPFGGAYNSIAILGQLDMYGKNGEVLSFTGSILLPDLQLSFTLSSQKEMTAAQWLQTIVSAFGGGDIPAFLDKALSTFSLKVMLLSMDVPNEKLTFTLAGEFTVGDHPVEFNIYLSIALKPSFTYDIRIAFVFSSVIVKGEITNANNETVISASWQDEANPLGLNNIAIALGFHSLGIPPELDMGLKGIAVTYNLTTGIFAIGADSANYGKADLIVFKPTGSQSHTFFGGLHLDKPIDLTNLPLVGKALSALERVEINKLQVLVTSAVISEAQVTQLNNIIGQLGAGYPSIPSQGMASTVNLSLELDIGSFVIPIGSGVGGTSTTNMPANRSSVQGKPTGDTSAPVTSTPGDVSDGTTWFNLQKAVGPVMFRRIGIRYQQSVLWFLLDAGFSMGGLSLDLIGMGVGSPLKNFDPQFTLAGLGLEFNEPGFSIGGALMKITPAENVKWEYAGGAIIKAQNFSITALGDYAAVYTGTSHTDTVPSMFIFGQVTGTFGGPPAFFVTGLAGGFGYNSSLRLPGMNEVYQFPFVAGAQDPSKLPKTPAEVLRTLLGLSGGKAWIAHEIGQYWFAAGLQFTSFTIVSTNALLVIEFGKNLQFALIGLSRARFPMSGPVTYAFIELQIELIVDPGHGEFALSAVLSPNSYVLDPSCKLMGGFAFYVWFTPNTHKGDFVITLGGYHPSFDPPDWYPHVPRVGFSWSLDSTISITGNAYFAMTPSAAMAGGMLSVTFQEGNLKAWFKAWADMLIYWNPFHFDVNIGVSVGASYRMDLWFTTVTLEIELGADLHLYGPRTGGSITVHWYIISFTIDFGEPPTGTPPPLQWDQFQQQLPASKDIIKIVPVDGLASNGEADLNSGERWSVRPSKFSFSITSSVPNSQLLVGSNGTVLQQGDPINIRPMQDYRKGGNPNQGKNLVSTHTIIITRKTSALEAVEDPNIPWKINAKQANNAKALWGVGPQGQMNSGSDQLVNDQLIGFDVASPDTALGFTPGIINTEKNLKYDELLAGTLPVQPGQPSQGPIAKTGTNTILTIEQQIADPDHIKVRGSLFDNLGKLGINPGTNADMSVFKKMAGSIFEEEPLIVPAS